MLDENIDWPVHQTYQYSQYYSDRTAIREFPPNTQSYDYIIIGAGPIGAALAYRLSQDHPHRNTLIIEKNWNEPDRIVGELMQPAGCQALECLGLSDVFNQISAVPVHGYCVAYDKQHLYVPYMNNKDNRPYRGVSFHHGRLVMNLRAACKAQANITCLEASVNSLIYANSTVVGVKVGPPKMDEQSATVEIHHNALTFVCDGISSQFRRDLHPPTGPPFRVLSHFCGFVLTHDPIRSGEFFTGPAGAIGQISSPPKDSSDNPLPMPHNGNVLLDGLGPVLLYQLSETETRVLADIPGPVLPSESNGQLRSTLRDSLNRAAPSHLYPRLNHLLLSALDDSKRIRCIGSKCIPAITNHIEGAIWIGDALNVRHPLTGGGMTVGLWDVVLLAELLRQQKSYERVASEWHWQRRPRALVINTLSVALHALFAAESPHLALLRTACFEYLSRGSHYTMHPSGFLSGLLPSPLLLLFHFFSVALLAVRVRVRLASQSEEFLLYKIWSALHTLWIAACVILPVMWKELQP